MYLDVEINIDIDDMVNGLKKIEAMERKLHAGYEAGIEEFGRRLLDKLNENIDAEGLGGTGIANTIDIDEYAGGFSILVGAQYAMFVEFGTGVVGSENPHPNPFIPWEYDVNDYGWQGWQYIGSDGKLHWTAGQKAKPFMYKTWLWGRRSVTQIIKKNIRKALKS